MGTADLTGGGPGGFGRRILEDRQLIGRRVGLRQQGQVYGAPRRVHDDIDHTRLSHPGIIPPKATRRHDALPPRGVYVTMQGIRAVMRRVTDQAKRSRVAWTIICAALAGVLFVFGASYLIVGVSATSAPGAYTVLIRYVPGDLHTYGAVLLLLSLSLIHGLMPAVHRQHVYDRWLRGVLIVVAAFCFLLVWMFAWSWVLSGVKTWQSMAYWLGQSVIALGLVIGQHHQVGAATSTATDRRRASA